MCSVDHALRARRGCGGAPSTPDVRADRGAGPRVAAAEQLRAARARPARRRPGFSRNDRRDWFGVERQLSSSSRLRRSQRIEYASGEFIDQRRDAGHRRQRHRIDGRVDWRDADAPAARRRVFRSAANSDRCVSVVARAATRAPRRADAAAWRAEQPRRSARRPGRRLDDAASPARDRPPTNCGSLSSSSACSGVFEICRRAELRLRSEKSNICSCRMCARCA